MIKDRTARRLVLDEKEHPRHIIWSNEDNECFEREDFLILQKSIEDLIKKHFFNQARELKVIFDESIGKIENLNAVSHFIDLYFEKISLELRQLPIKYCDFLIQFSDSDVLVTCNLEVQEILSHHLKESFFSRVKAEFENKKHFIFGHVEKMNKERIQVFCQFPLFIQLAQN